MPRSARRNSAPRRKRPTKWCSAVSFSPVPIVSALAVGDAIPLCDPTTSVLEQADPVVGWCRGSITIGRSGVSDPAPAIAWAIVVQRLDIGLSTPTQVFNPWATDDLERQDILGMGHCDIPPAVLTSGDARVTSHSGMVTNINVKVARKLPRNTNNLFLWVVALGAEDNAFSAQTTVRSLMKFG